MEVVDSKSVKGKLGKKGENMENKCYEREKEDKFLKCKGKGKETRLMMVKGNKQ